MNKASVLAIGAVLAVGAFCAASRLAAPAAQSETGAPSPASPSRRRTEPSAATQEHLAKLRARIKELEALVARQSPADKATGESAASGAPTNAPGAERPAAPKSVDLVKLSARRSTRRDSLLKLKTSNPDAFARAIESIAASARKTTLAAQRRIEFFSSLDESRLTDDELSAHREILALLEAQQDVARLRTQWDVEANVEFGLSREASRIEDRLRELYPDEKRALLRQAARDYGYDDVDAESFSQSLGDILGATQGVVFRN